MLWILPALTSLPSFVTGCHSFSSVFPLLGPLRPRPRSPRPLSPRPRSPKPPPRAPPRGASAIFTVLSQEARAIWVQCAGRKSSVEVRVHPPNWSGRDFCADRFAKITIEAKLDWRSPYSIYKEQLCRPRNTPYDARAAIFQ